MPGWRRTLSIAASSAFSSIPGVARFLTAPAEANMTAEFSSDAAYNAGRRHHHNVFQQVFSVERAAEVPRNPPAVLPQSFPERSIEMAATTALWHTL